LLEVGTGFHPDLTGRENVFFNGAILGMKRREIERKFDEIVAFAEVERFIDTPVKRYSSGMQLRLAFAVAAHLEPEVLIVDEVLAVGDAEFQRKCLGKMGEVSGHGRTVLLVSHNMAAITSLADRCVWLDQGRVRDIGDTSEIVAEYLAGDAVSERPGFADLTDPKLREGIPKRTAKDIRFRAVQLVDDEGKPSDVFFEGDGLTIDLTLDSDIASRRLEVLCFVRSMEGVLVFTLTSGVLGVDLRPGEAKLAVKIPRNQLLARRYTLDLYVLTAQPQDYLVGVKTFEVITSRDPSADPRRSRDNLGLVTVEHEWGALRQGDPHRV
jgi:lipopolysaccharide transport system ATP-binding protein